MEEELGSLSTSPFRGLTTTLLTRGDIYLFISPPQLPWKETNPGNFPVPCLYGIYVALVRGVCVVSRYLASRKGLGRSGMTIYPMLMGSCFCVCREWRPRDCWRRMVLTEMKGLLFRSPPPSQPSWVGLEKLLSCHEYRTFLLLSRHKQVFQGTFFLPVRGQGRQESIFMVPSQIPLRYGTEGSFIIIFPLLKM